MGEQELFRDDGEEVLERYTLVTERIRSIRTEESVAEPYRLYFQKTAGQILQAADILEQYYSGELYRRDLETCRRDNERLYGDFLPEQYEHSYANPKTAVRLLGETFGAVFSFLAAELTALIPYAFEGRRMHVTIYCELFVEIYNCFEGETEPEYKEVSDILYWFFHDYSEVFAQDKVREMVDPSYDFFTRVIEACDPYDLTYLYRYGEYISDNEIRCAQFLASLEENRIQAMADTMTEGFRIGYVNTGKDLSRKKTVCLEYPVGFERLARAVICNFHRMGLETTVYRNPFSSFGRITSKRGCYSSSFNRQFEFDHKADRALYLDKAYVERRLEAMQAAYEIYKEEAHDHAGPAVIETFGEADFTPEAKPEALQYTQAQNELNVYQMNRLGEMTNHYIPGDERSFTIIAYPIPDIGKDFGAIFEETVRVNTLDYMTYRRIQQKLIDVLDQAERVHVTGKGENHTDLWIQIHPLSDPAHQTAFENCVADVNIPVGEVFTSPVLKGTNGTLHVTKVYLNGLEYRDLSLEFTDGMVTAYRCGNFKTEEENHRFVYENLMQQHPTLPMGEFAIGTNTTAYKMARTYQIAAKLPILIAEKTGPHFAVGDTCYSRAEDVAVYNPDGKEIIARDNEISLNRKEDPSKAYFNCHTDITIPYDELGDITAVTADGTTYPILSQGRFAVPGTEELNRELDS